MKRFQINLDQSQHDQLVVTAHRTGTTVSRLIRRAIDAELAGLGTARVAHAEWLAALDETAGCAPGLPEGRAYLDEIRN